MHPEAELFEPTLNVDLCSLSISNFTSETLQNKNNLDRDNTRPYIKNTFFTTIKQNNKQIERSQLRLDQPNLILSDTKFDDKNKTNRFAKIKRKKRKKVGRTKRLANF